MELLTQYHRIKNLSTTTRPQMIAWDITNKCNLSCLHCLNSSGDANVYDFSKELPGDTVLEIAHQIANHLKPEQCCLCGGEPLLNTNIFDIVTILSQSGIIVNMVTNGLLLTNDKIIKLKDAGIYNIQVSIDGLGYQHDLFRNQKGVFDKTVKVVKNIVKNNVLVAVAFCPNKLNYLTFPNYVPYIRSLGCKTIRCMPFLPIGRGKSEGSDLYLSSKEFFEFVQIIRNEQAKYPELFIEWGDPLEHLFLILLTKRKYPTIMGISSRGELTVSPYLPVIAGDLLQNNLRDLWRNGYNRIWQNSQLLNILKEIDNIYDLEKFVGKSYTLKCGVSL